MSTAAPIVVLGMHRSGTSCLAAMLVAAGARVHGDAVRNWDNPRGHHEANALIRLNEDVLGASGGHWLDPPEHVVWTPELAAERDRILALPGANVWKDPRTLLVWPFWSASGLPFRAVGVARHPLAVARSLLAWRGTEIDEGIRLWLAHVRPLVASGVPILTFEQGFVAAVVAIAADLGLPFPERAGEGYAEELVHHGVGAGPTADEALLDEAVRLYASLGPTGGPLRREAFPWAAVQAALDALPHDADAAEAHARIALRAGDPAAVIAPLAAALLHAHQGEVLLRLLDAVALEPALDGLLRGKAYLPRDPAEAARWLRVACSADAPLYEARHLLPLALWEAGEHEAADQALADALPAALYPFRLHARRAEWAWLRKDAAAAFAHLEAALESAPHRRHGRLLHRRAAWRQALGDVAGAEADRRLARERDPTFRRGKAETKGG